MIECFNKTRPQLQSPLQAGRSRSQVTSLQGKGPEQIPALGVFGLVLHGLPICLFGTGEVAGLLGAPSGCQEFRRHGQGFLRFLQA
jgi:hypothetical protein